MTSQTGERGVVGADRLVGLVDAFARRVYPAVLDQHPDESISSPLCLWLLLGACAGPADGRDREALEGCLGCRAGDLLAAFVADPPPALRAAIAVWWGAADATPLLAGWVESLPAAVESGRMPTQAQADDWARTATDGLIERFPTQIDGSTRIVLASALALRVSWSVPFDVVPAAEGLGPSSPWHGVVERLLFDERPTVGCGIATTAAAGLVAVHVADAVEGVRVISVSADPGASRQRVLEAAHELGAVSRGIEATRPLRSLFEIPIGPGHSWQIAEREIATRSARERRERVIGASLPAWRADRHLDLLRADAFGARPATSTMRRLIGAHAFDQVEAAQAAVASFTRFGFEAAAITYFGVRASRSVSPAEVGVERTATLRYDHPYAALAIAVAPSTSPDPPRFAGLPLFGAWIDTPVEPEDDPTPGVPRGRSPRA
jgi:hypothetical protein